MSTSLEQVILRRVRRIHLLRRLLSARAVKAYTLVVCMFGLMSTVSVASVFANMPSVTAPIALGRFFLDAFTGTEVVVDVLVLGIMLSVGMLVRDMAKDRIYVGSAFSRV